MRVPLGREAILRLQVDNASGEFVDADELPTLTVTDSSGDSVAVGTVSQVQTDDDIPVDVVGNYEATLDSQSIIDNLTAEWTYNVASASRTDHEVVQVVGERIVPLHRLREDEEMADLSAINMQRLSDEIESWFKIALGFAPVEEFFSRRFYSKASGTMVIPGIPFPSEVRSITIDSAVYTVDDLANVVIASPGLRSVVGFADVTQGSMVEITGTHNQGPSWDALPGNLIHAGIILGRYAARNSNYPERARQIQTEGSLITFTMPSPDRPTGLPDVDSVISRYSLPVI